VSRKELNDPGLVTLLDLDGEMFPMDNGFWTKIDAKVIMQSDRIPHGVRYSLTLHNKSNLRVLGYDNAHGFKTGRKVFGAKIAEWDHIHEGTKVKPYEFQSAGQLLEDFWNDVERIIEDSERQISWRSR
jgi:hypothetical protein